MDAKQWCEKQQRLLQKELDALDAERARLEEELHRVNVRRIVTRQKLIQARECEEAA